MKISKFLFTVTLSILISSFSWANHSSEFESTELTKTISTKIKSIIQNLEIKSSQLESKTVKLKFMITENDEIVVLSTSDSKLDSTFKNALNYKEVDATNMKYNKVYILPVTFQ